LLFISCVAGAAPAAAVQCPNSYVPDAAPGSAAREPTRLYEILADLTPHYLRELPAGLPPETARFVLAQRVHGVPPSQLDRFVACFPTGEQIEQALSEAVRRQILSFDTEIDLEIRSARSAASEHIEAARLEADLVQASIEKEFQRLGVLATATQARLVEHLARGDLKPQSTCTLPGAKQALQLPAALCSALNKLENEGSLSPSELESALKNAQDALQLLKTDKRAVVSRLSRLADQLGVPPLGELQEKAGEELEEELLRTSSRYRHALEKTSEGIESAIDSGAVEHFARVTTTLSTRGDELRRDVEFFTRRLSDATKPEEIARWRGELQRLAESQRGFLDASQAIQSQADAVFRGRLPEAGIKLAAYDPNQLLRSAFGELSGQVRTDLERSFIQPLNDLRAVPDRFLSEFNHISGQVDQLLSGDLGGMFAAEDVARKVGASLGLDPSLSQIGVSIATGNWVGAASSLAGAIGLDLGGIFGGGGFPGLGGAGNEEVLEAIAGLRDQLVGIQDTLNEIQEQLKGIEGKLDYLIEVTQQNHAEVMALLRDIQFDVETLRQFSTTVYRPEEGACGLVRELPLGDPKLLARLFNERGIRDFSTCDDFLLRSASAGQVPGTFLTLATASLEGSRRQYFDLALAPPFRMLEETAGASSVEATVSAVLSGEPTIHSLTKRINGLALDASARAPTRRNEGKHLYADSRSARSLIDVAAVERHVAAARSVEGLAPLVDSPAGRLRSMECTRRKRCLERAVESRAPYSRRLWTGVLTLVRSALFQQQVLQGSVNLGHAYNALYGHLENYRTPGDRWPARYRRYQSMLGFARVSETFGRNLMHLAVTTRRGALASEVADKAEEVGARPLELLDWEPAKYALARAYADAKDGDARFLEQWMMQTGVELPSPPCAEGVGERASLLSHEECVAQKIPVVGYESWYLFVPPVDEPKGGAVNPDAGLCMPLPRAAEYTDRKLRESTSTESLRDLHWEVAERLSRLEGLNRKTEPHDAGAKDALLIAALRARFQAAARARRPK